MKSSSFIALTATLCATLSFAPCAMAGDPNRPIVLTGNFQMQVPMDQSGSTTDVLSALSQANQALGELMSKQCALLSDAFKRDCRVVQLNIGSNYSDNTRNFVRPGFEGTPVGNSNVNVTFQLAPHTDAK